MAIVINGKKFTGKITRTTFKEIQAELQKIPKPNVISLDDSKVTTDNSIICLEREIIHLKKKSQPNIQYVGSKDAYSCMVVTIYNETDEVVIHVDLVDLSHPENLNKIISMIQNFDNKTTIKVSIAGGDGDKQSENNLLNIIMLLANLSEQTNLDFTIESQIINERNIFTEQDKYEFVYNRLIEKCSIAYSKFFDKPIDISLFENKKVGSLISNHTQPDKQFQIFIAFLIHAQEVYLTSNKGMITLSKNMLDGFIKNENDFIQMMDKAFSAEGFQLFDLQHSTNKTYPASKLTNFVFNITTHEISVIKQSHVTPNETIRNAFRTDFYNSEVIYFLCYDKNMYVFPSITERFVNYCLSLENDVKSGYTKEMGQLFPKDAEISYNDTTHVRNILFRFVKLQLSNKSQKISSQNTSALFNKTNPLALYKQGTEEYKKNNYALAGSLFEQALKGFQEKENSEKQQGNCHYSLATLHFKSNNVAQALLHSERAMILFYTSNDDKNLGDAEKKYQSYLSESKTSFDTIYQNAVDNFRAKNYYLSSQQLLFLISRYDVDKQPKTTATAHSTLASCYRELGKIDLAIEHCDLALKILNDKQIKEGITDIETKRKVLLEKKQPKITFS